MPIYEYRCAKCETAFEALIRPNHDEDAECPHCGGHRLSRQMSTFASRSANGNGSGASEAARAIAASGLTRPSGGCCGAGGCGCH